MCQRMWAQQQPTGLSSHLCQPVVHDKGSVLQVSSCKLHLQMVSFREQCWTYLMYSPLLPVTLKGAAAAE